MLREDRGLQLFPGDGAFEDACTAPLPGNSAHPSSQTKLTNLHVSVYTHTVLLALIVIYSALKFLVQVCL